VMSTARTAGGVAAQSSWEMSGTGGISSCIACIIRKIRWVSRLGDTLSGYSSSLLAK
jgi:hypothetical protein